MKKFYLFFLFLPLLMGAVKANPIVYYHARFVINEVRIQAAGNWSMEIAVTVPSWLSLDSTLVDSLVIESNGVRAHVKSFPIVNTDFLVVITQDSMLSQMPLGTVNETLKLLSYGLGTDGFGNYFHGVPDQDILRIGFPDCEITALAATQSACLYNMWYHYKDNSPTLGVKNDTAGAMCMMRGLIADLNYNPVTIGHFKFSDEIDSMHVNADGTYRYNVLSRNSKKFEITDFMWGMNTYQMDTITVNSEPHVAITRNIHLLSALNGIGDLTPPDMGITLINAPNPFSSLTTFYINIPEKIKFHEGRIEIYNVLGEKVAQVTIPSQNKTSADLNLAGSPSGMYYYCLLLDNHRSKTGQIVLAR